MKTRAAPLGQVWGGYNAAAPRERGVFVFYRFLHPHMFLLKSSGRDSGALKYVNLYDSNGEISNYGL